MLNVIAILDDENDRLTAMTPLLRRRYPQFSVACFTDAPAMIAWLAEHIHSCVLLCLDHDLIPVASHKGEAPDPGSGRDVADFLAMESPVCPVIIHTTNRLAAPGMESVLTDSGWTCCCVVPYDDVRWIREVWIDKVVEVLSDGGS